MKRAILSILMTVIISFLFYLAFPAQSFKLFSPGPLSIAHNEFDELGNCGACHTKGKRLDNNKCLGCHKEIKAKIEEGLGYHARVSQECSDCHSEHHGKDYDIIQFNKESFDHSKTGWVLEGQHSLLKCEACHSTEGYLLISKSRCINCHQDVHLGQLGTECQRCHNAESFGVSSYKHQESPMRPEGKHLELPCDECHRMRYETYPSGRGMAVKYKGIDFRCDRCHEDIHEGEYGKDCNECHTQDSFEPE